MAGWIDTEAVVLALVASFVGGTDHTGNDTPADLPSHLPFVRVLRYGGPDDGVTDFASVDVDVYASTRGQAFKIAKDIRDYLTGRSADVHAAGIDHVRTSLAPSRRPWSDDTVRLIGATYEVTTRRTSS